MKNYWIAFILIVTACFSCLAIIIFKCFVQKPQPQLFYLSVDSMKMVTTDLEDSIYHHPEIVAIFPCDRINTGIETIPWADLYVCSTNNKNEMLKGDTALVLIDINTRSDLHDIKDIDHYGVIIKPTPAFKKYRVMVPASQINDMKKRRYKIGRVTLVDDWLYD